MAIQIVVFGKNAPARHDAGNPKDFQAIHVDNG